MTLPRPSYDMFSPHPSNRARNYAIAPGNPRSSLSWLYCRNERSLFWRQSADSVADQAMPDFSIDAVVLPVSLGVRLRGVRLMGGLAFSAYQASVSKLVPGLADYVHFYAPH